MYRFSRVPTASGNLQMIIMKAVQRYARMRSSLAPLQYGGGRPDARQATLVELGLPMQCVHILLWGAWTMKLVLGVCFSTSQVCMHPELHELEDFKERACPPGEVPDSQKLAYYEADRPFR